MTRTSGVGEVSRLAIMASMTWPWVASATSRTGQSPSMISGDAELVQKGGDHGQTPEHLLDTGRSVDGGFRHPESP